MLVSEFIDERYWPKVKDTLSPRWQRRTGDLLAMIKQGLGAFPIEAVPEEEAEGFVNQLRAKYQTPVTPNKVITRGKHLFGAAVRWKAAQENPFRHLKKKKEIPPKFTPITEAQHGLLFDHAPVRMQWYIMFARYTGGRMSSLAKLEERDVDVTANTLTFRDTKNGDDYRVPIHPALKPWIAKGLTGAPHRRLLPQYKDVHTVSQLFRRLKARVGITGFRFHDYRHNVGTRLAEAGYDVKVRMELLGHKDPRMAIRYTHIAQGILQDAVNKAL